MTSGQSASLSVEGIDKSIISRFKQIARNLLHRRLDGGNLAEREGFAQTGLGQPLVTDSVSKLLDLQKDQILTEDMIPTQDCTTL